MPFDVPAFTPTKLEEERNKDEFIFTVRLNKDELAILNECKTFLQQEKDSTAFKQLAMIGATNVLQDTLTHRILTIIFGNKRKNERLGVVMETPKYEQM